MKTFISYRDRYNQMLVYSTRNKFEYFDTIQDYGKLPCKGKHRSLRTQNSLPFKKGSLQIEMRMIHSVERRIAVSFHSNKRIANYAVRGFKKQ